MCMLDFSSLSIRTKITRLITAAVAIALTLMLITLTVIETERKWQALTRCSSF